MRKVQILYPIGPDGNIHEYFIEEAIAMSKYGFITDTIDVPDAELKLYRGFMFLSAEKYPSNHGLRQSWDEYRKTLNLSEYYTIIRDLTFPTFFVDKLEQRTIEKRMSELGWRKAFIKSNSKSLFGLSDTAPIWPDTPIENMSKEFAVRNLCGPFAVRKFIDNPQIFYNEQRYWVLNGKTYHPDSNIPEFVLNAASRIFAFSKSRYFTIDVAGNHIVEINPGESSDRGGDNPLDFFSSIFDEAFLYD